MNTIRGSPHYASLLPVEPSTDPPPVRPPALENDPLPNRQPPVRKRASRALARFLMAFCIGVAATLAWQSYGDAARQIIANSYPQLRWLAPQAELVAQKAPETNALVAPPSDQQLNAMSFKIDAVLESIDQIAAGQEQMARTIDQIVAGQEQTTRTTEQPANNTAQAPSINGAIAVESRAEVRPPLTKHLSTASGHDASCFPSASAVLQNHPGGWPTWTLKAPGHEGTMCWYASARPRVGIAPGRGIVGTTENRPSAPPPPYTQAPE
jgi:hypothetical protein